MVETDGAAFWPRAVTAGQAARAGGSRLGRLTLALVTLVGIIAFVAPFLAPALSQADTTNARLGDSPLITLALSGACLVVLFANVGPALSSRAVALLGVLVAINVVLRAFDLSFFPPGEFSPVFLSIGLVGYVFGGQMGFLMGALTMLSSALFTGGVGPWLPFQMFAAGWMGMTAALLPGAGPSRDAQHVSRGEVVRLAIFGLAWGFLYGVILNLYFWPFLAGNADISWSPGTALTDGVRRYLAFYAVQSAGPDLVRALGNAGLMLALGAPLLRIFRRFRARFSYAMIAAPSERSG
ncbi:MAG: ECF transporter S component [Anaerolineae bacterium]|nr:ECF transporter S component [Anaerolineae bacterium]